jgi:branched-chain amino acid transport system ATP-binding protein
VMPMEMQPVLKIQDLRKSFYGLRALDGVDMELREKELLGLMGPNGSGKSTLLNCMTGVLSTTGGRVYHRSRDITGWKSSSIYKLGIARTFQLVQLFPEMTVLDNMVGAIQESRGTMFGRLFRFSEEWEKAKAQEILEFLKIDHVKNNLAKNLSYGQQKLVDLGMVLMADPSVVLLDEPLAGVNPTLGREIIGHILELVKVKCCTVLIIEHNAKIMLDICDRIVVLNEGRKIADGHPDAIKQNPEVLKAYFGA